MEECLCILLDGASDMEKLREICQVYYNCEFIPLYIYEEDALLDAWPGQAAQIPPPQTILAELRESIHASGRVAAFCYSKSNASYFMIQLEQHRIAVGGPIFSIPCSKPILRMLHLEYGIKPETQTEFDEFIHQIPTMTPTTLIWKANLLFYCLTGQFHNDVLIDALLDAASFPKPQEQASARRAQTLYDARDQESFNNSYELESILERFVMSGDVEGYRHFLSNLPPYHPGQVADDSLRAMKNYGITTVTLVSRKAMDAGLPRETAYALSDSYITTMERLSGIQEVSLLISQAILDYITRVKRCKAENVPEDCGYNRLLQKCINYVHQNLNRHISIQDVADHVNLSRSYLSTTFKKYMGISLNHYILEAKLEEACSLLKYTDKPITEISNYLCFSSQSHFQSAFKKKYEITPLQYRMDQTKL